MGRPIKMFLSILTLIIVLFCLFFVSMHALQESSDGGDDINRWCQTTPHPDNCKHSLGRGEPRYRADFRIMSLEAALKLAHHTQTFAGELHKHGRSKRKKAVGKDCYKLVNNTILQLNQTLMGLKNSKISDFDAQTWLSASLTNLQTCFSGCGELNLTNFVSPIRSSGLTEMISNTLAINQFFVKKTETNYSDETTEDFPRWVTQKDRKLLQTESIYKRANVIVSQAKGSKFRTIQSALDHASRIKRGNRRFIIFIRRGVYRENLEIGNDLKNIMFLGDGLRYTIITADRSVAGGFTTYSSATVGVDGTGFIARGITFRNTAGPTKAQAVAFRSASDLSVFYACSFEGYQDTLFVLAQRQFYKLCYIYGTVDFIFGNAAVVFQNCMILARKPLNGQANMITAQGRGDPFQNTGISIHNSRVMAAPDLKPVVGSVQTFLGRPWQEYSRTVFMKTFIDTHVNPKGWSPWGNTDFAFKTLYYGEYGCFGPGAATKHRVKWLGYHIITSASEASQFTVERLISGRAWLRATEVPFITGL